MGLVINPTAFRIGYVKAWTDAWYLHRIHYSVFIHKSLEIKALLQYVLLKCYPSQWSHWIYSHTTYYYSGNKFQISLFIYDGNDPYQYNRFAKKHKYGWYKKSKFYKYWTKKQLLDLKFFYQRWYLLCQAMNLDFEELQLDNLRWRVNKRHLKKMAGLRKKYGLLWVAREDLFIWKFIISLTSEDSFNKMGINVLNKLFKTYILPRIKNSFKSSDHSKVYSAINVLRSHKIFYFFFSYINKILKYIPIYPVGLFNKLTHKLCYRFFRIYFIFKPYWINLSKFYELILLYININSKIKIYILDNNHLNASYLARYIITCLRYKFNYRDTMIPIKKTLLKYMFAKRWRPIKDFKQKSWQIYLERYKHLLKDRIYFHLINSDVLKMFLYRLKLLKKFKHMLKKPIYIYKKFSLFNFHKLKKLILFINKKEQNYIKLYIKNYKIFYNYKTKIDFFNFFEVLNIKYWKKKNKFKFVFFKKLKKSKFKFIIRKFKFRKNIYISMKKKYLILLNIYNIQIKRLNIMKNLFFSLFYTFKKKNLFYFFENINLFNNNFEKFIFKAYFWFKKKRIIKFKLNKILLRNYKRRYRVKAKFKYFLFNKKMRWIRVKKFFKNKRRIFVNFIYRKIYTKKIFFKDLTLKNKFFRVKKLFIIFFKFKEYYNKFNIIKLEQKKYFYRKNFIKFFFYNKLYYKKKIYIFFKNNFIRNYTILFFFYFLNNYSKHFKPFIFETNLYKKYIKNISNLKEINLQFPLKEPKKYNLEEMPLKDKFKRLRILESGSRSLLYGYKFHFIGRFTRKQKAASLWFAKGANSVSSMRVEIDYGFYTVALRYSACTLKVWLYRNKGYSFKYGYRLV